MASNYVPLSSVNLHLGRTISVIGVVVDIRPPVKTKDDYMVTFIICDKTKTMIENGLTVRFFNAKMKDLPPVQGLDEIVIFRDIKVNLFNDKLMAISTFTTAWIIGSLSPVRKDFLIKTPNSSVNVTPQEINMINTLRDFWKKRGGASSSRGLNPQSLMKLTEQNSRKRKFAYIKDMKYDHFYDLLGVVVKTYPSELCFTVYLTDYTQNTNLHRYEWPNSREEQNTSYEYDHYFYAGRSGSGSSKWPGPYGQYTLQITLWDIHARAARKIVKDGCLLSLNNVRAKMSPDGKLEGSLHGDYKYPERVDISLVKDRKNPHVEILAQRKKEYERRATVERAEYEENIQKEIEEIEDRELNEQQKAQDLNQNVITRKADNLPNILIGDILNPDDVDLTKTPYVNRKYKTICRVVDFLPNKLEQFCIPKKKVPRKTHSIIKENGQTMNVYSDGSMRPAPDGNDQASEDEEDDDDEDDGQRNEWEFRFALLVEGKDSQTMRLIVDDKSAQFLLNMDPTDLKADSAALAELREKLFVLWGDLEERKSRKFKLISDGKKENRRDARKRTSTTKQQPKKRHKAGSTTGGKRNNNSDHDSGDDNSGESEDENGLDGPSGKFFPALVREYGVKRVNSEGKDYYQRMFGLFDVQIKF